MQLPDTESSYTVTQPSFQNAYIISSLLNTRCRSLFLSSANLFYTVLGIYILECT